MSRKNPWADPLNRETHRKGCQFAARRRQAPSLTTKLAAALLTLGDIPYPDSKALSADQICSLYVYDHYPIRHEDGGPAAPWNLVPRLIKAHREKTAKTDRPQSAKGARIRAAEATHKAKMAGLPDPTPARAKRSWGSRKLQSRGFPKQHRPFGR